MAETLRRSDLAKEVAKSLDVSASQAEKAVTATFQALTEALQRGDKVTLTGFGTFDVAEQAGREGRNPATGATIQIAPRKRVRFKLGSELDAIR